MACFPTDSARFYIFQRTEARDNSGADGRDMRYLCNFLWHTIVHFCRHIINSTREKCSSVCQGEGEEEEEEERTV